MPDTPLWTLSRPSVPPGRRCYVVGDIHGRYDLLLEMLRQIRADATTAGDRERIVVYLGDYVDRGPSSREVIEVLLGAPLPGFRQICLTGNHEEMMGCFLDGPPASLWLFNGGIETMASYGIDCPWQAHDDEQALDDLHGRFRDAVPEAHSRFIDGLKLFHIEGDYFFVHAGARPGRRLSDQSERDFIWIREPFLGADYDFGKCIIHGHTITARPDVCSHRIGIDTGAFHTGRLTCLVLDGTDRKFLHT